MCLLAVIIPYCVCYQFMNPFKITIILLFLRYSVTSGESTPVLLECGKFYPTRKLTKTYITPKIHCFSKQLQKCPDANHPTT